MRKRIDARHLLARRPGLFLRVVGHDLQQRGVHRLGRRGVVLHERVHGRGDVSFEHEPSDMRRGGQRVHRRHHHDLQQRGVQRRGWLGVVLHERLHGRDDVCVEHESSDLCRRV